MNAAQMPIGSAVRPPAFAGNFYPADVATCLQWTNILLERLPPVMVVASTRQWLGGIVPHAAWMCSGQIAGHTLVALSHRKQDRPVDVVVVFGAVHTVGGLGYAALDPHQYWMTPQGPAAVQMELQAKLIEAGDLFRMDEEVHQREHAVEVELPLIRAAFGDVAVLPIETPPIDQAMALGQKVAQEVAAANLSAIFLASSDLTHYGPHYRFTPAGVGVNAMKWELDNDRRLIDLVVRMQPEAVLPEIRSHLNACGGGAIVAMMAACRELGASDGKLLSHANSYQTLEKVSPIPPDNAVGYAAVVVG
jgi:hypothetical protein